MESFQIKKSIYFQLVEVFVSCCHLCNCEKSAEWSGDWNVHSAFFCTSHFCLCYFSNHINTIRGISFASDSLHVVLECRPVLPFVCVHLLRTLHLSKHSLPSGAQYIFLLPSYLFFVLRSPLFWSRELTWQHSLKLEALLMWFYKPIPFWRKTLRGSFFPIVKPPEVPSMNTNGNDHIRDLKLLYLKKTRLQLQCTTLMAYVRANSILGGLRIQKGPTLGCNSDDFCTKWCEILNTDSLDLMVLVIEYT